MNDAALTARRMWALFEPVHTVIYFAPEAQAAFEAAGVRGFWRGYFAGRAAPIGAVGAPPVIAAFFTFAPSMVSRAVPGVWELITPEDALRVRSAGAVASLRRLVGGGSVPAGAVAAADLLSGVTERLDWAGRPLGGPNAALPIPDEPLARLWRAATVLREHRGDGHVAALVAADIDGCEALVLRTAAELAAARRYGGAAGGLSWPRQKVQPLRGWSDAEWNQAAARLTDRGMLDAEGVATLTGAAAHRAVEEATDRAAARPWARIGIEATEDVFAALGPVGRAAAAALPFPNPIGVPAPEPAAAAR